jgi:putative CocE/NonD family hydrolase
MLVPTRLRAAAVLAATAVIAASAVAAAAPKPKAPQAFDYTKVPGLSQPTVKKVEKLELTVPAEDGKELYIEVTKPAGPGTFPVILEASPYHGPLADRDGTRILPDPKDEDDKPLGLTGFFAPRGYAVVMMDLRGTGRSQGCLDHLGPKDAADLKTVVEWAASQPWSNGRVGMTGHSYVGSTPMVAAAQNPKGLVTIVPSAGLASMYDHQFQGGVPFNLQYAGPQWAYELISINRSLPPGFDTILAGTTGDNFGKDPQETGCGLSNSALFAGTGQVTGQYEQWHAERDHAAGATAAKIPAFLVHGVNDNAARITAADWFMDRGARAGDKAWIGQWDHGSGFAPTRRGIQWPYALLGWFDKHLKQKKVNTGPAAEMFLNDAATLPAAKTDDGEREILTGKGFPLAKPSLQLFPSADGTLGAGAPEEGSASYTGDPRGQFGMATGRVAWETAPMTSDLVLAGVPELKLVASTTSPQVHLIANLLDKSPDGSTRRISQFALNPMLREGVDTVSPFAPGTVLEMTPPAMAMAHKLAKGHVLVLEVRSSDPDKVAMTAVDPRVTVLTGPDATSVRLPVISAPTIAKDALVTTDY